MDGLPEGSAGGYRQTRHHYELAHVALKQICFNDPPGFFRLMASPGRDDFLGTLWSQICQNCDHDGPAGFQVPGDLVVETFCLASFPAILVHMPPPRFTTEAYFIGMIMKVPVAEMEEPRERCDVEYFTLERGEDPLSGGLRTVLCGWQGETHLNFGDGPPAEPGAFVAVVQKRLEGNC